MLEPSAAPNYSTSRCQPSFCRWSSTQPRSAQGLKARHVIAQGAARSASPGTPPQRIPRPVGPARQHTLTRCRPYRPENDLMEFTQACARGLAPAWAITLQAFSPSQWPQFSIPRIPFIQRLAILLTKTPKFCFKILLRVMFRLTADVFAHRINVHRTHAEFSVATLP